MLFKGELEYNTKKESSSVKKQFTCVLDNKF
ncbi:hypothetical protein T4A_5154 [Trichinella pseudospiralis]|uniref:Uncharacterized protein n=1 Tax=Trichinella pseudospiralis TaxID=6337 RepID=A0A0V1DK07_TRIPS|nr:hypothetical protein T4A_5154 [Trichinella pseudospiralis]